MLSLVEKFIKNCVSCQLNKHSPQNKMSLKITTTSKRSFQKLFLDIVGPLPLLSHNGKRYILTLQDDFSKYSLAIALENQEADTVAKVFAEEFICKFGVSESILTDQGSNFMSSLFQSLCKLFQMKKFNSTAYHPETERNSLECTHKSLGEYLRNYTSEDQNNFQDSWLPFAIFSYNTTPHSSTGYMSYELVFAFKPNLRSSLKMELDIVYNYDDYLVDLKYRIQKSFDIARQSLLNNKEKTKIYFDKKAKFVSFKPGEKVLLKNEHRTNKLSPIWSGPYNVIKISSPENTLIKIGNKNKLIHNNRLKKFN